MKLKLCFFLFCLSSFVKSSSQSEKEKEQLTDENNLKKLISAIGKNDTESENRIEEMIEENNAQFEKLTGKKCDLETFMEKVNNSGILTSITIENESEKSMHIAFGIILQFFFKNVFREVEESRKHGSNVIQQELDELIDINWQLQSKYDKLETELVEKKIEGEKMNEQLIQIEKTLNQLNTATIPSRNCQERRLLGDKTSGVRTVHPFIDWPEKGIQVYCDQTTDHGGWTVFQNRDILPNRENFYREWLDYATGFGNLTGEYWLGLNNIYSMTKSTTMELRIDLRDQTGEQKYAKYKNFSVENEDENFRLNVGRYEGTAGDSLSYHNAQQFSTSDRDNADESNWINCAKNHQGAWWYDSCAESNLNGIPLLGYEPDQYVIFWKAWRGKHNAMASTRMMFRPQEN